MLPGADARAAQPSPASVRNATEPVSTRTCRAIGAGEVLKASSTSCPVAGSRREIASRPGVSVRLTASAEVWVCVLNARGKALVDGQILQAGAEEGPFHSGSFTVSFGNGEVQMRIDGREAEIPATSSPVGYAIDTAGNLSELEEAERPTCA